MSDVQNISTLANKSPYVKSSRIKTSRKRLTIISNLEILSRDYKIIIMIKNLQDKL